MAARPQLAPLLDARARTVSLGIDRSLPLADPLAPLFPRGLPRGSTVVITPRSGITIGLALTAKASARGCWCAVAGVADLGACCATELGVRLDRLVIVPNPGPLWPEVAAELLEHADMVLVRPWGKASGSVARQLAARARRYGSVLVVLSGPAWPETPDVVLDALKGTWQGLGGDDRPSRGHLYGRLAEVSASWRRGHPDTLYCSLWLPSPDGMLAPA